jgi:glyoxylase-like metal-dependent hydrolase (beta-lactamase superfamily II)
VRGSGPEILAAAPGPIAKIILSHAHADHRGAAPELEAPIYCHPDEVDDAQTDWPQSYLDFSLINNERIREGLRRLNQMWDSGPVQIAGTVDEGDEVAGMRVVHVPGHAPGEIALFRAADGLLLAGDAIYTQDAETGQPASARVPHQFANWDTEQARASIRKLITYKPTSVWLGHSTSITGDVEPQLKAAAPSDRADPTPRVGSGPTLAQPSVREHPRTPRRDERRAEWISAERVPPSTARRELNPVDSAVR